MNTDERYDIAVLIGRFQPFHNGHAALLKKALEIAGQALVALGSAHQARSVRNPFTWEERAAMIGASLDKAAAERVRFIPVRDCYDDRRWAATVTKEVQAHGGKSARRVALVGFRKDASSDYLSWFPDWACVALGRQGDVDATAIRRIYFGSNPPSVLPSRLAELLPAAVLHYLEDGSRQPFYALMRAEYQALEAYRKKWGSGPFVTVDAVVTAANHVLLIRRGQYPGQGLWAVPGGFLERQERLLQGAIRELKEETRLEASVADLEHALRAVAVFDHPERSQRGRVITHAHWFDLDLERLPATEGADDAAEARWIPIADLPALEAQCFEDHFHILDHFLRRVD
jgi:bifunctional NMN adenylyltransferase/nudix hydrolase